MKIILALIAPKQALASGPAAELFDLYFQRANRYTPCEKKLFGSEAKLLEFLVTGTARTRPALLVADSRGEQLSSPELATALGTLQDNGTQLTVIAVGPADGWSPAALARADRKIAFGRITLPHELAAVVLAEQTYRALTIRAGHPYHCGH